MQKVHKWENVHNILDNFLSTYHSTIYMSYKKFIYLFYIFSYILISAFSLTSDFFKWVTGAFYPRWAFSMWFVDQQIVD